MTNLEKYNKAFCDSFEITENKLNGLKYQQIDSWDSVGHMTLVSNIEDTFDIMMETDDIIEFNSYEQGKLILRNHYGIEL